METILTGWELDRLGFSETIGLPYITKFWKQLSCHNRIKYLWWLSNVFGQCMKYFSLEFSTRFLEIILGCFICIKSKRGIIYRG
ncbi:MAG: hypothetical protein KGZ94_08735 [Clostridia bacterium]|nr:hypothetical protein [Clostridia bacterium]